MIRANDTILFQGDSITDAGRNRQAVEANRIHAMGCGYAGQVAARLLRDRPGDNLKIINQGVSGNRIVDLYARWKSDAINLSPDLISILIGVNDTGHEMNRQNGVEVDRYEALYRMLLELTREKLPEVRLVLCDPFVMRCGQVNDDWVADIDARRDVVQRLAEEFSAAHVPFQSAMDKGLSQAPPEYWTTDGVHPTPAGHCVMAECCLESVAAGG